LRLILASLIIFSLVILFLFALFPSDISISRLTQINSTQEVIRSKIVDLRQWKTWNEMYLSQLSDSGKSYRVDSNYISLGNASIKLLNAGKDSILTRWRNGNRDFTGTYILTKMNGGIVLEWSLHFHLKWYPWEKLASMFYDKQLGTLMENSLSKLKMEVEAH
jgi:hypothetical protein